MVRKMINRKKVIRASDTRPNSTRQTIVNEKKGPTCNSRTLERLLRSYKRFWGQWISVETSLPEKGVPVLVASDSRHVAYGFFDGEWQVQHLNSSSQADPSEIAKWIPLSKALSLIFKSKESES